MAQIFPQSANALSKVSIIIAVVVIGGLGAAAFQLGANSSYATTQGLRRTQPFRSAIRIMWARWESIAATVTARSKPRPMPTSHPTKTCMNCHSQIWVNSPTLEPVRASYRTDQSIPWLKVHDLPDFVYFNHSIHIKKGVGCETCHGRVDEMPLMYQKNSLEMRWCIDCHRHPESMSGLVNSSPPWAMFRMAIRKRSDASWFRNTTSRSWIPVGPATGSGRV